LLADAVFVDQKIAMTRVLRHLQASDARAVVGTIRLIGSNANDVF